MSDGGYYSFLKAFELGMITVERGTSIFNLRLSLRGREEVDLPSLLLKDGDQRRDGVDVTRVMGTDKDGSLGGTRIHGVVWIMARFMDIDSGMVGHMVWYGIFFHRLFSPSLHAVFMFYVLGCESLREGTGYKRSYPD